MSQTCRNCDYWEWSDHQRDRGFCTKTATRNPDRTCKRWGESDEAIIERLTAEVAQLKGALTQVSELANVSLPVLSTMLDKAGLGMGHIAREHIETIREITAPCAIKKETDDDR